MTVTLKPLSTAAGDDDQRNALAATAAARLPNPINLFHMLAPALDADGKGAFPAGLDTRPAGTAAAAAQTGVRNWYAWLAPRVARPGEAAARSVRPAAWNEQQL